MNLVMSVEFSFGLFAFFCCVFTTPRESDTPILVANGCKWKYFNTAGLSDVNNAFVY